MASDVTRVTASYVHEDEQPSRLNRLPSSHCSPASSTPFPHEAATMQVAVQVVPLGGSHASPRLVSTHMSPQTDAAHCPEPLHRPVGHAVHRAAFVPGRHCLTS